MLSADAGMHSTPGPLAAGRTKSESSRRNPASVGTLGRLALTVTALTGLFACTGSNGTNGSAGPTGTPGANGLNTLVVVTLEPAGANCANGGDKISTGLDKNGNGILDASEVISTRYICNGAQGTSGPGLTWVNVSSTTVQATSDTGYLANNTALVTVNLPTAPAIGGVFAVTGVGAGGWTIAQNAGQYILTTGLPGSPIPGALWTLQNFPAGQNTFQAAASSADGLKLVMANGSNNLATSSDGGVTWVAQPSSPALNWYAVASSADGVQLAAAANGGGIYTSADSGVTWIVQPNAGCGIWYGIASSADGTKLAAVCNADYVYTSTDTGVTWTLQTGSGIRNWYGIASSADGSRLIAAAAGDDIYTSSDFGVTWTPATTQPGNANWYAVASSADGNNLVAVNNGGFIYTSSDFGVTWIPRLASSQQLWTSVAASSSGDRILAGSIVSGGSGSVASSLDSGVTWTQDPIANGNLAGSFTAVTSSADGNRLMAADNLNHTVSTSIGNQTTPGVAGSLSGKQSDAVKLQYIGDGVFIVLDFANNSDEFVIQ